MKYLTTLPRVVPGDLVLVHNNVRPTRRLGSRGFRAWLTAPNPGTLTVCDCGWAPELGQHFRVRRGDDGGAPCDRQGQGNDPTAVSF